MMRIVSTLWPGACPPPAIWSMEGEAAQERRAVACSARVIDWLCVDFAEAMNDEKLYRYSGWLHGRFDLLLDRDLGQGALCR